MSGKTTPLTGFEQMNLNPHIYSAIKKAGYETPTPIQVQTIPHLIQGKDVLGQARTGTGKTAAFALPMLSRIKLKNKRPQTLVLTPTRELAIQVADSFKTYGKYMKGLNVLPVYGGQSFGVQLNQIKRGVHVVVGTPGRLMDHMRRKTISFSDLSCVIIDEADEMLHMGFIDDVEWILGRIPDESQSALFSATMPAPIRKIAQRYLTDPEQVIIRKESADLGTINQKYWLVGKTKKAKALLRILDSVSFDGVIVFTKTRAATLEVAKSLESKGFKAEALNGDMAQAAREQTVKRLKNGHIDILVATDVAARGLDVDRISHVINYDMPSKVEPYIHRIGRTGRAGRTGTAILFLNRNEKWMLKAIQRSTKKDIREMILPTNAAINKNRVANFNNRITTALTSENLTDFEALIEGYAKEKDVPVARVAAALAKIAHGNTPFFLPKVQKQKLAAEQISGKQHADKQQTERKMTKGKSRPVKSKQHQITPLEKGMERYRIEVGRTHGLRPKDIVGAISNEAGLESKYIGRINIDREFSFVDLPFGMPNNIYQLLKKTWIRSRRMAISKCA